MGGASAAGALSGLQSVREKIAAHFEDQTTTEPAVPATIQTTLLELSQNLPTVSGLGSPPEIAEKFKFPEEWFLKNGAFHDPQSPFQSKRQSGNPFKGQPHSMTRS